MDNQDSIHSKPISQEIRPEITRLPSITLKRKLFRRLCLIVIRLLTRLFTHCKVRGLENIPEEGSVVIVSNHLGDADLILGLAISRRIPDVLAKSELYDLPVIGKIIDAFGVIWVHRGQPDRRAIRAALKGIAEGRLIGLAPEGRESLSGGLEEGTHGAAFLAIKSGVPILPVTFTGTDNWRIYPNLKRIRRSAVTITIGQQFRLETDGEKRTLLERGTRKIMQTLAQQLPPELRGVYSSPEEAPDGG
jgi:1-acyl-sn-glycerol-3-phosphate acyltransferase